MYRILTTGGSGFVGRHLMKYLGSLGYEVDNIGKGEFMHENFEQLDTFKPDVVVHCAWPKLDLHKTDHLEFAELTCHFFEECKKRGIRVINLGSSSEYGVKYEPMKEDMICEPINTYGIAKLAVTLFAKKLGFNTLRLFTVTGEGGHSFQDTCRGAKAWSDEKQVRHCVSVQRVCLAIQRLIHAEHIYGEVINMASPSVQRTNLEIAEIFTQDREEFGDITADNPKWDKYPQTQYEPSMWQADTTKMQRLLNL